MILIGNTCCLLILEAQYLNNKFQKENYILDPVCLFEKAFETSLLRPKVPCTISPYPTSWAILG